MIQSCRVPEWQSCRDTEQESATHRHAQGRHAGTKAKRRHPEVSGRRTPKGGAEARPYKSSEQESMAEQIEVTVQKKPRVAMWIATGSGLGYLPIAPGTWGSLGGVIIAWVLAKGQRLRNEYDWQGPRLLEAQAEPWALVIVTLVLALAGVWAARKAAKFFGKSDPGQIVIDEISGQQITYLPVMPALLFPGGWKYLLLGFLLFRIFDIVKPPPARQAEKWPHGWGIMADDWFAGLYAAAVLWVIRWTGWIG
jgi:phosphatidylglycerophosphatase A